MQNPPDHKAMARWLMDLLRQGLVITRDISDYMAATFGTTDLSEVLKDEADSEIDSLLDLIFYPDLGAQLSYETRWGARPFTADQQSEIEADLCTTPMDVPLLRPAGGGNLWVQPPEFALAGYVQRLKITWQTPEPLARTIEAAWPGDPGLSVRVHLRNARLQWHPDQIRLMQDFLAKKPAETDDSEPLLLFLLSILPEMMPANDAFQFLMAKKFFFFQALCRAEDFERRRNTSNMEIMMLQGNRSAHGSLDEWRLKMRHIDDICRHLFGRTHFFQQPGNACIDLQAGDSGQHIQDIMRVLS